MNLGENVRLVHGRDTCDEGGRPLSKYVCDYHQGYRDALDGWSWSAGQVADCGGGPDHHLAGLHVIVRCVCDAGFMSTDGGYALNMARAHERAASLKKGKDEK